jgi:hypothetical protein
MAEGNTTQSNTLNIVFETAHESKTFTISLPNARTDLEKDEVVEVANFVIEKKLFTHASNYALTAIKDITVTNKSVNDLYDPA